MTPEERSELIADIVSALHAATPPITEDETRWVRLAIQQQCQRAKFRQAVIEKTLAGLVWAAIVGLGYLLLRWGQSGFR
jgi:hypothetical protein